MVTLNYEKFNEKIQVNFPFLYSNNICFIRTLDFLIYNLH
jgi:hypothetical protein